MKTKKRLQVLAETLDLQRLNLPARPKVLALRYRPVEHWPYFRYRKPSELDKYPW